MGHNNPENPRPIRTIYDLPPAEREAMDAADAAAAARDGYPKHAVLVTADNFDDVRRGLPSDQAETLKFGCVTWRVDAYYDDPEEVITVWPYNGQWGRAGVSIRPDASWADYLTYWGDWVVNGEGMGKIYIDDADVVFDDDTYSGRVVDAYGDLIEDDAEEEEGE